MASSSERRLSLLKRIGYNPDIIDVPEIDENIYINEKPDLYVKRIAREKAEKISKKYKNSYIIAADTVIFSGAKIYGKAFNESDAFTILKKLSGRRHRVYGAICLISPNKNISLKLIITQVSFRVCIIQIHFVDSYFMENILNKQSKGLHSLISIAYDKNL